MCRNPFVQGMHAFGCGQCMPCRVNRRRIWTHRLMLEGLDHSASSFVTLTYSDDYLPVGAMSDGTAGATLVVSHLQDFLKRLRFKLSPVKVRYYSCGEYGDLSWRPHYHIALFGFGPCLHGRSRYSLRRTRCCTVCDTITDTWGMGFCFVGELEVKSAAYIAGYMTKKMTKSDDPRLLGRAPEFATMSRRPGIGAWAMDVMAHSLLHHKLDTKLVDVPESLRHGTKLLPLGRYLKQKLRERIGREIQAPEAVLEAMAAELSPLSRVEERYSEVFKTTFRRQWLVKEDLIKAGAQKALNSETRSKLYRKGKPL